MCQHFTYTKHINQFQWCFTFHGVIQCKFEATRSFEDVRIVRIIVTFADNFDIAEPVKPREKTFLQMYEG